MPGVENPGNPPVSSGPVRTERRQFQVLRLSLTSECNFHCLYCNPLSLSRNPVYGRSGSYLSSGLRERADRDAMIERVSRLHRLLTLKEVHLTGGEPTLHPDLVGIVSALKRAGIPVIALTTNGSFLSSLLPRLQRAGLDRLNVSMDALDDAVFRRISGRSVGPGRILANIEAARRAGINVKMNTTILGGINEGEILPLLEWAGGRDVPVRFLEFMRMGPMEGDHRERFFSMTRMLELIATRFSFQSLPGEASATARYFVTREGYRFGIIANHTAPFCDDCNRLRMDSRGNLFGCLGDRTGRPMPATDPDLERELEEMLSGKKNRFEGSHLSMKAIGG